MSDNELKTVNLIRVNLLECILKELVIVKTKKMEVLEELHITSLITNYFISEPALIRVKNFIKETEGFSLSVSVGDAREYEAMQLFQYDIKKIINAYAYQLYLEIQHGHLRSDTTVNGAN